LGTLLALCLAVAVCLAKSRRDGACLSTILLLTPAFGVFLLVSSQTGFNRYFRYVLPCLPFLYIWLGSLFGSDPIIVRMRWIRPVATSCLLLTAASYLAVFPHSMSYFNELVGGPKSGWRHLLDANLDWGQDLYTFRRWALANPGARPMHLTYFGFLDPALVGMNYPRVACVTDGRTVTSREPGWYAISVNDLCGYKHGGDERSCYADLQQSEPAAMAGYSIYIYHVAADCPER